MKCVAAALAVAFTVACSDPRRAPPPPGQHTSPNASILPAPLAAPSELAPPSETRPPALDAAPLDSAGKRDLPLAPPVALNLDKPLPSDSVSPKDGSGYELRAEFRWNDVPGPPSVPEVSTAGIKEASAEGPLRVSVEVGSVGRMRLVFEGPGFSVPERSELRSRTGFYGHALVWPDGTSYRNVQPGSVRALLEEGRLDVSPLLRTKLSQSGTGTKLSRKTASTVVETSLGVLTLEQAVLGAPSAGDLVCRLLVELVGTEPSTDACRSERIPVNAQYRWASGGSLAFVVTSLVEKKDLAPSALATPPEGARFSPGELPIAPLGVLVSPEKLARFRTRPAAMPGSKDVPAETALENRATVIEYLLIDGVTVAGVRPKSRVTLGGVVRGKYAVQWRDFFGTASAAAEILELPGAASVGPFEGDAGP